MAKRTPTYMVWIDMKQRCYNPKNRAFPYYGGRGISVCKRWKCSFANFWLDMGNKPAGLTIERINNNGNYSPTNCKWATRREQVRNKRDSRFLSFNGKSQLRVDWARELGIMPSTIIHRQSLGLPIELVLQPATNIRCWKEFIAKAQQPK